jgi:hypothetical protein
MQVYENALSKGISIPTTKTVLKFPPGILREDIADSYLVSGGRFLFTFEPTWLSLWDLHATDEEGRPTHLLRKHIMEYDAIIYIGTVELNKIRIIIEARSLAPGWATASYVPPSSLCLLLAWLSIFLTYFLTYLCRSCTH